MWVGQGVLAGLFLFAGGFKLMAPAEMMAEGLVVFTVLTAIGGQIGGAAFPFLIGIVLITIGRGRWHRLQTAWQDRPATR